VQAKAKEMTTSLAAVPHSHVEPTGPYNIVEIGKFAVLCGIWISIIFGAVWLACWAVGELLPQLILSYGYGNSVAQAAPVIQTLMALVPLVAVMVFIPINAMFMVLCERRALALFTVRKGPNRVGPDGMFQTAADAVKLLFKEDITPDGADPVMFTLAPIIFFAPSIFGAMPLLAAVMANHPLFVTMHIPTGIFFVLAMSAIPVVALVMGGWASNNKYSLVGGLRAAAQAISYEIPLVLSLVTVCYLAGSLDVVKIAADQAMRYDSGRAAVVQLQMVPPPLAWAPPGTAVPPPAGTQAAASTVPAAPRSAGLLHWNLFGGGALEFDWKAALQNPTGALQSFAANLPHVVAAIILALVCIALLFIYMTGACAEINRIPFDLPEAESELVSGYNTEYSGIKFAIFFLAEFTNLFIVATIVTVMFLGGGSSPIPGFLDPWMFQKLFNFLYVNAGLANGDVVLRWVLGSLLNPVTISFWLWTVLKVYSIVILAILVRGTLPRFRIDQLMDFGWKRLIPLSLVLFLAVAFLREIVHG
jgi:NADH-quinone oxidoreductase subunit H